MKVHRWSAIALLAFASLASAATVEKPVRARFNDRPIDQNPVSGYVQFGQLADGTPAVQKINSTTVRFYERATLVAPSGMDDFFAAQELNCKTGIMQIIGMGAIERIRALDDPPDAYSIKAGHPRNLPVYREVCTSVGVQTSW